jgi:monofunctional biosynthetic peptidoglycan transglycosylase
MGDSLPDEPVTTRRLRIAGMSGPNCVGRVERALRMVPGVHNAVADLEREMALIRVDEGVALSMIAGVLDQAGYRLHAVDDDLKPEPAPEPPPAPEPAPAPEPSPKPAAAPIVPPPYEEPAPRTWRSLIPSWRTAGRVAVLIFGLSIYLVLLYRFLPVPITIHMIGESVFAGRTLRHEWVPIEAISPNLVRAVIAAEDGVFCTHWGFDFAEIERSWKRSQRTGRGPRGASTISQQTAKNVFLWNGRSYFRKGLEAYFTALIELLWPKQRIMEVYLNSIEYGPGVFGAEAAARYWFKKSAARLTPLEAARLAAILPNPKRYKANPPGPYVASRSATVAARAATIRTYGEDSCVRD